MEKKIVEFDNDEEFLSLCVDANPTIYKSEKGTIYYDYNFTPYYTQLVSEGKKVKITDPNSKIMKRHYATRGCISKHITNLAD